MRLLLVGGSSSVGKTVVARELSARLNRDHVRVDDLRRGLADPALRQLQQGPEVWDLRPEDLCSCLVRAGEALAPHLQSWINQVPVGRNVVLEGEGIEPALITSVAKSGAGVGVVVIETDVERIYKTLSNRSKSFAALTEPRRRAVASMNQLYGLWLQQRAREQDVAWVHSQPWVSLADRIIDAISGRVHGYRPSHAVGPDADRYNSS